MWKKINNNTYQSLTDKDIYVGVYKLDDIIEFEVSLYEKFSLHVFEIKLYSYSNIPALIQKSLNTTCQKVVDRGQDFKFYIITLRFISLQSGAKVATQTPGSDPQRTGGVSEKAGQKLRPAGTDSAWRGYGLRMAT